MQEGCCCCIIRGLQSIPVVNLKTVGEQVVKFKQLGVSYRMEFLPFSYLISIPLALPNLIWTVMTVLLTSNYLFTYVVQSHSVFASFLKYTCEYGNYKTSVVMFDLPKRYFTHYYVVASLWNTACSITVLGLCYGAVQRNWIASAFLLRDTHVPKGDQLSILIVFAMLTIQSYRRLYECLFVSVYSSKNKINIIQYAWGFLYYITLAPTLISEGLPLRNLPLGSFQLRHILAIVGFAIASFIHHQSHVILADLRKKDKVKSDSHGIPEGGMFTFVSCPHYFAEILIYICILFLIHSQCASWWLVMIYNIVAHVNMAAGSHQWYKRTFPSYPSNRKALIPFIY